MQNRIREVPQNADVRGFGRVGGEFLIVAVRRHKVVGAGKADGILGRFQPPPFQHTVLQDKLTLCAGNFQPVRAGHLAGGGNEHAGRTVRVFGKNRRVVLDLYVVVASHVAVAGHALRHTADPLPQVKIVGRLVQQHAAALARPGGTPRTGIIVMLGAIPVCDDPHRPLELPELPTLHDGPRLGEQRVRALVQHQGKHFAAGFCLCTQCLCDRKADVQRFFHQHMQPSR